MKEGKEEGSDLKKLNMERGRGRHDNNFEDSHIHTHSQTPVSYTHLLVWPKNIQIRMLYSFSLFFK